MSRRCELTAKGPQVGHTVSHSNIKTKRRFLPNLVNVTFIAKRWAATCACASRPTRSRASTTMAARSLPAQGQGRRASPRALELKRAIQKKVGPTPAPEKKAS